MIDSGNDALPGTTETRRYRREWPTEDADVSSSSDDYARRFAGAVGQWFLDIQTGITLDLLRELPPAASVLDVGGGHAQVAPPLIAAGYDVTVIGSDSQCSARLWSWIDRGRGLPESSVWRRYSAYVGQPPAWGEYGGSAVRHFVSAVDDRFRPGRAS